MKFLLTILLLLPTMAFSEPGTIILSDMNTISFNSKFTGSYVAKKQIEAFSKCMINTNSEITIVLYTPGGSVQAGQLFFDTLKALPCQFNTLTIFSASMGYQTVQNLGHRYILPSGILMSHRAYVSGLSGEIGGELDSIIKLLTDNVTELDKIAANRVGLSLGDYQNEVRDELWMTGNQAVDKKHADEVVLARCDASLKGTYFEKVDTFFGSYIVEFSNCPLVTGILSVRGSKSILEIQQVKKYYENLSKYVTMEL